MTRYGQKPMRSFSYGFGATERSELRRYPRLDGNHKEIRKAFESLGCSVIDLSQLGGGIPDLAVFYSSVGMCVEIKDGSKPPSARKLTPDEERFRMNWKGGYRLVENLDHVLETVNVLKGWQAAILAFHRTVLVAPPVTKGKAESHIDHPLRHFDRTCPACLNIQLNQVVDDYDLTSNDTRRGD